MKDKSRFNSYLSKYSKNSRPKIGWEGANNINHFKLVHDIYKYEFGISRNEINDLFLQSRFEELINSIDYYFADILSTDRIKLIAACLRYRYKEIAKIIGG